MGGTSTDVALCDRDGLRMTNEASVAGLPVAVPVMDIHTVGAGGGSIARIDEGGSLRVGPESAGADPGPACYGRSLLPTVTDAHLLLGHFGGAGLLGGDFDLDEARSHKALAQLAGEMSKVAGRQVTAIEAAQGVLVVANTNMERALRRISVERGYDSREFTLLPFGGAGGLHAVQLAKALRIPKIIVPNSAGALSAIGVLAADVVKNQSRTTMLDVSPGIEKKLDKTFKVMERTAAAALRREGFPPAKQRHERSLALRYKGQSFELDINQRRAGLAASFSLCSHSLGPFLVAAVNRLQPNRKTSTSTAQTMISRIMATPVSTDRYAWPRGYPDPSLWRRTPSPSGKQAYIYRLLHGTYREFSRLLRR